MKKQQVGIIGMAVMGKNLALNISDHGFSIAIYNRTYEVSEKVAHENPDRDLVVAKTIEEFVELLELPRRIIVMVKAGQPVDDMIQQLTPFLEQGDLIIDAGNSYYKDTIRRESELKQQGFRFMGTGVSGGEEGARHGPAIMPGGSIESYDLIKDVLIAISAVAEGEPCTTYIGPDGAGHYVKMVHNGIEYADMQLISEAYHILKHIGGFSNAELAKTFSAWNEGVLDSYLIQITAEIFREKDDLSDGDLIDMIKDTAGQKGTGIWTSKESMDLGVDASIITAAVNARFISAYDAERKEASQVLVSVVTETLTTDKGIFAEKVKNALYASKIASYAQGFSLLEAAAQANGWKLDYQSIAKIFRGGCIIRAKFLNRIASAYQNDPTLKNLLLDPYFTQTLADIQKDWRTVISSAVLNGIPVSAFSSALSYYDSYRSEKLPTNLVQAQRDYFGAHTYKRVDREGSYHHLFGGVAHE